MRSRLSLALSFCLLGQQAFGADLCQSVATQLRAQPDFISGRYGLEQSVLETSNLFQKTVEDEHSTYFKDSAEVKAYNKALEEKFALPKSLEIDEPFTTRWVEVAPTTDFFALAYETGSARCQYFGVYRRGNPASSFGSRVPRAHLDGLCENTKGAFGLLSGAPAFIVYDSDVLDYSERLYITPLTSARWGETCKLEAHFEPEFKVAHVFVQPSGIAKDDFAKLAVEFTRRHGLQREDPAAIGVGLPISEDVAAPLESMAAAMRDKLGSSLPKFGASEKVEGYFTGLKFYPLLFQGHPYMMRFSFGMGYHNFALPQAYLVLFEPRDGKLVPVASAEVDISRGGLSSVSAGLVP